MRVYIRHDEIYLSSSASISIHVCTSIYPQIPISYEYAPTIAQLLEGFVDLPLYKRRGTASAGAEIDECVVSDGRAEDGLERARNEGGGGCRLEDWGFVLPEKGETCLDEGAERSGEPRFGS